MYRTRRPLPGPRFHQDGYGRLMIDGMTFMGRVRVPPMPPRFALQDRVTGEYLVLSHTGTPGSLTPALVSINPTWRDVNRYGEQDGPIYGSWRLFIASGVLQAEASGLLEPPTTGRILTRNSFETTVLEVSVDDSGSVVYTEYTI